MQALELLKKFAGIAGVDLYLHDKYHKVLHSFARSVHYQIKFYSVIETETFERRSQDPGKHLKWRVLQQYVAAKSR